MVGPGILGCVARCGTSGKQRDPPCRCDSAVRRVVPQSLFCARPFRQRPKGVDPLRSSAFSLRNKSPGRFAARDPVKKGDLAGRDNSGNSPGIDAAPVPDADDTARSACRRGRVRHLPASANDLQGAQTAVRGENEALGSDEIEFRVNEHFRQTLRIDGVIDRKNGGFMAGVMVVLRFPIIAIQLIGANSQ